MEEYNGRMSSKKTSKKLNAYSELTLKRCRKQHKSSNIEIIEV